MLSSYANNKGVALITVLLVIALAAVLATQMTARLQIQMQRSSNVAFNQQAYWYAMGAEAFAKRVLLMSFDGDENVTHLQQMWAQGETNYPVDFGAIKGEISDLQSCFNLNALRTTSTSNNTGAGNKKALPRKVFEELVINLGVNDISQFEAEYMADALTDWLDSNSAIASAGGAEDNDYSAREFPYLPANNFLASAKELRVIEHFTLPVLQALKDYVCVIPESNLHKININTIKGEHRVLIQALLDISSEDAEQLLSARDEKGFDDINAFLALPELTKHQITDEQKQQFVVDSEYFTLQTTASFNNSYFSMNSIMKIENNKEIHVISRTIGRD